MFNDLIGRGIHVVCLSFRWFFFCLLGRLFVFSVVFVGIFSLKGLSTPKRAVHWDLKRACFGKKKKELGCMPAIRHGTSTFQSLDDLELLLMGHTLTGVFCCFEP